MFNRPVDRVLALSAVDLAQLGTKFVTLSLDSASELVKQGSAFWLSALSALDLKRPAGCCDIPETECPPRCVCKIEWEAARGEKLTAVIQVTNSGTQARKFTFSAKPFSSAGGDLAAPTVTPGSVLLKPGQSVNVTAELTVTQAFQPGTLYSSEVLILGTYEQCACITLTVKPESVCHCSIEQGDPPLRLRAHQWYDHFQCAEPCGSVRTPGGAVPDIRTPAVGADH